MRSPKSISVLTEVLENGDVLNLDLDFAPLLAEAGISNIPDLPEDVPSQVDGPLQGIPPEGAGRPNTGIQIQAPDLPDLAADATEDAFQMAFLSGNDEETVNYSGPEWHVHDDQGRHDHESTDIFVNAKPDGVGGSGGKPQPEEPPAEDPPPDTGTGAATSFWSVTLGKLDDVSNDYYNIELQFFGDADLWGAVGDAVNGYAGGLIDAFLGSAQFLTSIISQGYASDVYDGPYADLENGLALTTNTAEDLVIEAYLSDIDGVGGILGRAGSYDQPDTDGDDVLEGLPTAGLMEFDVADAGDLLSGATEGGLWNDTVLHEMIHVLGFGTLWDFGTEGDIVSGWDTLVTQQLYVLDNGTRKPSDDVYGYAYTGAEVNARLEPGNDSYWLIDGQVMAAVESTGGSGTARGHWSEAFYDDEIMTGYINSLGDGINAGANYMADITIAALADLGYALETDDNGTVDYDAMAAAGTHFLDTGEVLHWSDFDAIA